ncbi:cytochrome P450 [Mycena alexandri]|uniref:Cytochrome P450 n=1 Tax=Mycena alexandri TaxID=1745969 RepID=A0AAD6STD7_9AGAR|nr:cytochrome P450 [Mycena alexandri]
MDNGWSSPFNRWAYKSLHGQVIEHMTSNILPPLIGAALCYVLYHAAQLVYRKFTHPLRNMLGPKNPSYLFGNHKQLMTDGQIARQWRQEFGPNFILKGIFSISRLHTSDLKALNHVANNPTVYQRVPAVREITRHLLGDGLLSVEPDDHQRQNHAFGVSQIRIVTEIFVEKAVELRGVWTSELAQQSKAPGVIDVLEGLRRTTLNIIGKAGFNHEFNALDTTGKPNELNEVFTELFHTKAAQRNGAFRGMRGVIPALRILPLPGQKLVDASRRKMLAISAQIVADSKRAFSGSEVEKDLNSNRDLVSVLLKANMSTDLPPSHQMSDEEIVSQIPTFLFAGHETTSSASAWALHALSLNIDVQTKLREELFTLSTENPTTEELNSLLYLDSVVKETLRVHSPVAAIVRMAMQDDMLPLATPYIDNSGKSHDTLLIPKGQIIHVPISIVNTDTEVWGPDAAEFRPERWENVPAAVKEVPGVMPNLLTFFAGPTNCIGFRFSVTELKALLFILVRGFEFAPTVPKGGIGPTGGLQTPTVLADSEKGTSLPLSVQVYNA